MDLKGFKLIDETDCPSYDGHAKLYIHEKTGFKAVTIDNKDKENFFSYIVYTPCENSSGVFHIIEHTVLSGSKKYPVKDAFTVQMSSGCPTFMNAMTGADRTYYLASSAVVKDFENIFNVYSDAVFAPLLRKETFMQEGIRVSYEGEPHFDGVVFSEMQGATSQHESVLSSLSSHGLFSGCQYENESGGNPKDIARLSYEEYVETYKKYYVPSNMCLLIYGSIDKAPLLNYIDDEYLKDKGYEEPVGKVVLPERWSEPREAFATSSSSESGGEKKASVLFSWLLNDSSDGVEGATLQVLTDLLLGSPGCPLYKAIVECPYSEDISTESGMIWDYSAYAFACGMAGVRKEDVNNAKGYLLSAIEKIAKDGFSEREKEAALRRNEFNLREISGGNPQGMKALFRIDKAFAYSKDILSALFPERDMAEVRRRCEENPRYFEEYIEKNFINNKHRLLSVVLASDDKEREIKAEMDKILHDEMKKHPKIEDDAYISFSLKEDGYEAYKNFRRLRLNDLEDVKFESNPGTYDDKIVSVSSFSNGIVYLDAAFDVSDFNLEELESLNVYSRLLTMCSTKEKDMQSVQTDIRYTSGGYAFYIESGMCLDGNVKIYFMMRVRSLKETINDALNEFTALLNDGLVDEVEIKNALTDISTDYKSGVIQSGHTYAISSSSAPLSTSLYIGEKLSGLSYWYTIEDKRKDVKAECENIVNIKKKLLNRERIKVQTFQDKENEDLMRKEAESFLTKFPSSSFKESAADIDVSFPKKSAFLLSTPVSYSAKSADTSSLSFNEMLSSRMLLSIISTDSLWSLIRAKGGAYGTGVMLDNPERRLFFYTYRDPRGLISQDDFSLSVTEEALDEKKLEDAKINIKSLDFKPQSPSQKALVYLRRRLFKVSDDYRKELRDGVAKLSLDDVQNSKKKTLSLLDAASSSIITDTKEEKGLREKGYEIFYLPI